MATLNELKQMLLKAQELLNSYDKPQMNKLYTVSVESLGTDASPKDKAPDYLGCADTVSTLINKVLPQQRWTGSTSTYFLRKDLIESPYFREVTDPQAGDVVISATGYGGKNGIKHGHTGIYMGNGVIASNSSRTGKFDENFTLSSWKRYYCDRGGYELKFFRLVD